MSLARQLTLCFALVLACVGTFAAAESSAKLSGSKLNKYGDGYRATRGLERFTGDTECALDRDGSLLASQRFPNANPNVTSRSGVRVTRLTVNGRRALSFGTKGTVRLGSFFNSGEPVIDSVHRILIAGSRKINGVKTLGVLRLTTRGKPDKSFGSNGFAAVPSPGNSNGEFTMVRPLPEGRTAVATATKSRYVLDQLTVFNASGVPDLNFADGGVLQTDFAITDVTSGGSSRILLAGTPGDGTRESQGQATMYNATGSIDASWGNLGMIVWSALPPTIDAAVQKRILSTREPHPASLPLSTPKFSEVRAQRLADGRFVFAMSTYSSSEDPEFEIDSDFVWSTRASVDGQLDPTYGTGGYSYGSDVSNGTSYMDSGDFEAVEWELLPSGQIGIWNALYGFTYEVGGVVLSDQGVYEKGREFELKYLPVDEVVFDPKRKRVLVCGSYKKRQSVFSLKLKS